MPALMYSVGLEVTIFRPSLYLHLVLVNIISMHMQNLVKISFVGIQ